MRVALGAGAGRRPLHVQGEDGVQVDEPRPETSGQAPAEGVPPHIEEPVAAEAVGHGAAVLDLVDVAHVKEGIQASGPQRVVGSGGRLGGGQTRGDLRGAPTGPVRDQLRNISRREGRAKGIRHLC